MGPSSCGCCVPVPVPVPVPEGWLPKLSRVLQNFETAVRENVTINGQPWEETSEGSELQSGMCCFPSVSCWVVLFWFLRVVFLMGQFSPQLCVAVRMVTEQIRGDSSSDVPV